MDVIRRKNERLILYTRLEWGFASSTPVSSVVLRSGVGGPERNLLCNSASICCSYFENPESLFMFRNLMNENSEELIFRISETYSGIRLLESYRNLQSYWTTTKS